MYATRFRELLSRDGIVVAPGAIDPFSATLVESVGFDAVYLGGGYNAGAALATPEPVLTMSEILDLARRIAHTVDLPLIVDGNAGFGNPSHTYRTVGEFARNDIAALHIEDQVYPKRMHYHEGIHRIVDTEEMVAKIRAAVQARDEIEADIVIIARTDAARGQRRTNEDITDAADRVNAYLDAGADVGMLFPGTRDELRRGPELVDGPLLFVNADNREPDTTVEELDEFGYDVVLYGLSPMYVVKRSLQQLYRTIATEGRTGLDREESQVIREEIEALIGLPSLYDIEDRSGKK